MICLSARRGCGELEVDMPDGFCQLDEVAIGTQYELVQDHESVEEETEKCRP